MLASVTGVEEAEVALTGGADIIDLKDPAAGALGALPVERVRAIVATIAGRRPISAVVGDASRDSGEIATAARALAAAGVDYLKIGLFSEESGQLAMIQALADLTKATRCVAVLFADREGNFLRLVPKLAEAGFRGVMLDTADKMGGRLLDHAKIAELSAFVKTARTHGLVAGLAGGLEQPDVPRLLALDPDVLGFRGALCAGGDRQAGIDLAAVKAIRRLIPLENADETASVDYRLLSARGYHPDAESPGQVSRVYVRDFVLPVKIGAYSYERDAPQKVRFDVVVEVQRARGEPQGMGQVFSYDLITDTIAAIVAEGHIEFVETLAERIGTQILRDPRASRVTVKVEKLERGPGGVGVEFVMARPDQMASANPVLAMLPGRIRKSRE
jgi:dihydroneopterin aldolase